MTESCLEVTISTKSKLAEGISSFELVSESQTTLPSFTAGSHIDVYLQNGFIRQYSLWNDPSEPSRYCLGVLKDDNGRGGSEAMHSLQVGSQLKISTPRNNFALDETAHKTILIAGGIGITPILSMAQRLQSLDAEFTLHYCTRSPDRMAFRNILEVSDFRDRVHLHFDDGSVDQKFDMRSLAETPHNDAHLYVCGPTGFMDVVLANAKDAWPASRLHREYFSVDMLETEGGDRAFKVQLKSTGDIHDIPADKSIIEVLAEVGIEIQTSCEQGICGTCITPVLKGTPDHRDLVLTEEEHADNDRMTLCCSRALTDLLVLDL